MRLPAHETGFDLANSLHPARYRDNAIARVIALIAEAQAPVEIVEP